MYTEPSNIGESGIEIVGTPLGKPFEYHKFWTISGGFLAGFQTISNTGPLDNLTRVPSEYQTSPVFRRSLPDYLILWCNLISKPFFRLSVAAVVSIVKGEDATPTTPPPSPSYLKDPISVGEELPSTDKVTSFIVAN